MKRSLFFLVPTLALALAALVVAPLPVANAQWYPLRFDASARVQGDGSTPLANCAYLGALAIYDIVPTNANTASVHAAVTLGAAGQTVTTAISNPDVPRTLSITGNAAGIAGNVVIVGRDIAGASCTDTIALNGTATVAGAKAFRTVTSIALPAKTNGSGDAVSVGVGNKFALPNVVADSTRFLISTLNGANDTGTFTATGSIQTSLYTPNGTPNGTYHLKIVYLLGR